MTILSASAAQWLFQAAAGARDTLLVRPLPPIRTTFEQVVFVASGITSLLTVVLVVALLVALIWLRRTLTEVGGKLNALSLELKPLLQQATAASQSVKQTSDLIRDDVSTMHDAIHETSARVRETVGNLADRVDDFADLLGKVHHTADSVVDIAGTTIKGLAWGARALRDRRKKRKDRLRSKKRDADADEDLEIEAKAEAPALETRKQRRVRRAREETSDLD